MMPYRSALNALTASCQATSPVRVRVEDALGRITAAPVNAPAPIPSGPIALQDGWAVAAEETLGATPYAPALASTPMRSGFSMRNGSGAGVGSGMSKVDAKDPPNYGVQEQFLALLSRDEAMQRFESHLAMQPSRGGNRSAWRQYRPRRCADAAVTCRCASVRSRPCRWLCPAC